MVVTSYAYAYAYAAYIIPVAELQETDKSFTQTAARQMSSATAGIYTGLIVGHQRI